MDQTYFIGLTILNIHKEIPVNIDEVINIFLMTSKTKGQNLVKLI